MAIVGEGKTDDIKRILEENLLVYEDKIGQIYDAYKPNADKIFITDKDPYYVGDPDRFVNFLKIWRVAIPYGDRELSVIEQLDGLDEVLIFSDADIHLTFSDVGDCISFINRYMTKPSREYFMRYPDDYKK